MGEVYILQSSKPGLEIRGLKRSVIDSAFRVEKLFWPGDSSERRRVSERCLYSLRKTPCSGSPLCPGPRLSFDRL